MSSSLNILNEILADTVPSEPREKEKLEKAERASKALCTVLNYTITDAFGLEAEESMWVGYHLNKILKPLNKIIPTTVLIAVDREMYCAEYSRRLMDLVADNERGHYIDVKDSDPSVKYAPLSDWVEWIGEVVLSSYPTIRPMIRSAIIGSIHGLFQELGINEDPQKSRASLYLPNSIRYLANKED